MADAVRTEVTGEAQTESLPPLRETPPQLSGESRPKSRFQRFGTWLVSPDSRAVVYLGLILVVAGFAAIAFAWSEIAATLSVGLQLPYVASGGFVGLGLVVVGVGVISIGVKRRDNFSRLRQIQKLSATMESIEGAIVESDSTTERTTP